MCPKNQFCCTCLRGMNIQKHVLADTSIFFSDANLKRFRKVPNIGCGHCPHPETLFHQLFSCPLGVCLAPFVQAQSTQHGQIGPDSLSLLLDARGPEEVKR